MIGGLKKSASRLAIVAAAGMFVGGLALTPAKAADLGGDCCADLEERVADLEATTARKGNNKVSLTISGHVSRVVGWYDDEYDDSEFYSAGNGVSGSRVQFSGSAKLSTNWTAGYVLRMRLSGDRTSDVLSNAGNSGGVTPVAGLGADTSTNVSYDRNYVYLSHAQFGTIAFGQAAAPTDGVADISLAGRDVTGDAAGTDWNDSNIQGFDLEQDSAHQAIAYISPTIAGFTLAVAWADLNVPSYVGTDDDSGIDAWDAALRYANEFGPIRVAAGIGVTTLDSDDGLTLAAYDNGYNVMGSVALMHVPTGLNVAFGAGTEVDGGIDLDSSTDANYWHVEGGINQNFFGVGNTSIYGEYGNYDYDDGSDEVDMWGVGIVQNFDSAATELFLAYRDWEQDGVGDGDVKQVMAGMRIKF